MKKTTTQSRLLVLLGLIVMLTCLIIGIFSHYMSQRDISKQTYYLSEEISTLVSYYELEQEDNWQVSTFQDIRKKHPRLISNHLIFLDALGDSIERTGESLNRSSSLIIKSGNNLASSVEEDRLLVSQAVVNQNGRIGIIQLEQSLHEYPYSLGPVTVIVKGLIVCLSVMLAGLIVYYYRRNNQPVKYALSVVEEALEHPEKQQELIVTQNEWSLLYEKLNHLMKNNQQLYFRQLRAEERLDYILNSLEMGIITINLADKTKFLNEMATTFYYRPNGLKEAINQLQERLEQSHKTYLTEEITLTLPSYKVFKAVAKVNQLNPQLASAKEIVIVLYDVTPIKTIERAHGALIRNVAHELKTPITSIVGFAETLLEEQLPLETQQAFVEIIDKEGKRLNTLVNKILELLKTEHQTPEEQLVWEEIDQLITSEIAVYEPLLKKKKILVQHDYQVSTQIKLPEQYVQPIIKNLLENAIHYSPINSTVVISMKETKEELVLTVIDEGIGIAEEEQDRIFEKFYRVGQSRDRRKGGTGLGLSIVKNCVEQLDGKIHVQSQVDKGTSFVVFIPKNHLLSRHSRL
ncbi:sensor histidine kinase [Vagococcus xieshaowenii]|uniref:histidine kinase n=1 Tax=Vagococcus xieshaowenii TaxID=2562451 RepID=A0AAJ5JM58_9ENTE|nr:sensor histidine kinase [Vagococcus xieshaowenii]QCA28601.1 HAMP domain-containing histidine kinase [Vagococcus xieshaowenii]TFZ40591.1 HAMP domain-containing histidine kinase [Vagococcus xieshaowenii]